MTRNPIYCNRGERLTPYQLTFDYRLKDAPIDSTPPCDTFKRARKYARRYHECEHIILELLTEGPIETYWLWLKLDCLEDVRSDVLRALLEDNVIRIVLRGTFKTRIYYCLNKANPNAVMVRYAHYLLKRAAQNIRYERARAQ